MQTEKTQMGRRVHMWGYAVCLCPTKRTPGLNELNAKSTIDSLDSGNWDCYLKKSKEIHDLFYFY